MLDFLGAGEAVVVVAKQPDAVAPHERFDVQAEQSGRERARSHGNHNVAHDKLAVAFFERVSEERQRVHEQNADGHAAGEREEQREPHARKKTVPRREHEEEQVADLDCGEEPQARHLRRVQPLGLGVRHDDKIRAADHLPKQEHEDVVLVVVPRSERRARERQRRDHRLDDQVLRQPGDEQR